MKGEYRRKLFWGGIQKETVLERNTEGNCIGTENRRKLYWGGIQTETVLGRNTDGNCMGAEYRRKLYGGGIVALIRDLKLEITILSKLKSTV